MSIRKLAGLAAGFALAVGLIGAGVGAQFTDSVTANQNISVGTFSCQITAATPIDASNGIAPGGKSLTYTVGPILSSAPSNAPFTFTVTNTGTIPQVLTVSSSAVGSPFSAMLAPATPVALAAGGSQVFSAGLQWTELDNSNLGQSGTLTYTVGCNGDMSTVAFSSDTVLDGNGLLPYQVSGTGFTPGPITVSWSYAWGTKGYVYTEDATANASGIFSGGHEENCYDQNPPSGVLVTTDQTVIVTATDGVHSATGTGILHCSLF